MPFSGRGLVAFGSSFLGWEEAGFGVVFRRGFRFLLLGFIHEVAEKRGLEEGEDVRGFAADGGAVEFDDGNAEGGGGGDKNLIGTEKLLGGEFAFHDRDIMRQAFPDEMCPRGAGVDVAVVGVRDQGAVLQDGKVGVRALGDNAVPNKDAFVHPCFARRLAGKDVRDQVEGFGIAVRKARVGVGDTAEGDVQIADFHRAEHYPQVGAVGAVRKSVRAEAGAAAELHINPLLAVIHAGDQVTHQIGKRGMTDGRGDAQQCGAPEQAVDVLIQLERAVIPAEGDVIDAVAEVAGAVEHRNLHPVQLVNRAVVITQCLQV